MDEIDLKGKKKMFPEEATSVAEEENTAIMKKEMLPEDEEQANKQTTDSIVGVVPDTKYYRWANISDERTLYAGDGKSKDLHRMLPEDGAEDTTIMKKMMLPEDEEQASKHTTDSVVGVVPDTKYYRWANNSNERTLYVGDGKSEDLHRRGHRDTSVMRPTATARNNSSLSPPPSTVSTVIVESLVRDDKIDSVPVDAAITDSRRRPILPDVEKHSWSVKAKRGRRDLRAKNHKAGHQQKSHPHQVENSHGEEDDQDLLKKRKRLDELETDDHYTDFTSITSKKQRIDESGVENKKMELDEVDQEETTSVNSRPGLDEKEVVNMVSSRGEYKDVAIESRRVETINSNHCMLSHEELGTELPVKSKGPAENEGTSMFGLEKKKKTVSSYENQHMCTICNKSYTSHQALGGHMSSHCIKKIKDGAAVVKEGDQSVIIANSTPNVGSHKCNQCDKSFRTGQALGGHKRCHFTGSMMIGAPISSISRIGPVKEFSFGNKSFPRCQTHERHETHQSVASVLNKPAPKPATSSQASSQDYNLSETGHGEETIVYCNETFLIDQSPRTQNNMALLPEAVKLPTSATSSLAIREENDHSQAGGHGIALAFDLNEMPAVMEGEGEDLGMNIN